MLLICLRLGSEYEYPVEEDSEEKLKRQQKGLEIFMHAHPLTSSSGRDGAIQSLNVPIGSKPLPRT